MTLVAGRIVHDNGAVIGVDEKALRAEARDIAARRAAAAACEADGAARWLPYYRDMVMKAASRPVGLQRWIGNAT
jgi:5-methylthioadenosine/S-adenosylhomocysteine deaminase